MFQKSRNNDGTFDIVVKDGKFYPITHQDVVTFLDGGGVFEEDLNWTLANVKLQRIADMNAVCRQLILAKWPMERQTSVLAGIYPLQASMAADISSLIAYSNDVHTAAINACGTIDDVLAYDINAGWPVI